jgi:hypothetical protein
MAEFLNKIATYNIFNYLLPGVIWAVVASRITQYDFLQGDLVVGLFFYYFIGLVISRFGSLVIEPLLRALSFVKFTEYSAFVIASKNDAKLDLLSEAQNTYRTIASLFVALMLLKAYELLEEGHAALRGKGIYILLTVLLLMFLFSYCKQTAYISKRIEADLTQ